jgi:hypothetical protein
MHEMLDSSINNIKNYIRVFVFFINTTYLSIK